MPSASVLPSPEEIRAAAVRLAPYIRRTPLRRSEGLSEFMGGDVWLKLECEQLTGSYKIRGATNALTSLDPAVRARGVITASAGNHGLGVAAAAKELGIAATVYVPSTAPAIKRDRIVALGATVDETAPHYDAAEALARAHAARTGATFVSPCTGHVVLAGQGTVALEVLEDLPTVRTVIAAVGGAGLTGGIAGLLRAEAPSVRLVGAQSERTNAMAIALASGKPTEIPYLPTLADGLAGMADADMLAQAKAALDQIVVVTEDDVASAIAFLWIEEGLKVEGAGAVPVAAVMEGQVAKLEFPVAIVVSGGNIDDDKHRAVLDGKYNGS
jgi:threonine dehydratase